ncbi:hypothetical protein [Helicobacter sp. T3_23-1059]
MQYISGWQALNIQSEQGHIADWHSNVYFKDFKPTEMYQYDENSPLKMLGIKKRFIPFLQESHFVASYARAIADLVYLDKTAQLRYCARDFLNDEEKQELFSYLKIINQTKNVENFIKLELASLYLKDKNNA